MKRFIVCIVCALFTISLSYAQEAEKKQTVKFSVEGMDCANCVKKVEKNIAFEKGVTDLKCDLPTKTVEVTYRTDRTDTKKLAEAFKKIKMVAVVVDDKDAAPKK